MSSKKIDVWYCNCGTYTPMKKGSPMPECEHCRRVQKAQKTMDRMDIEKCNVCSSNKWRMDEEPEIGLYCTKCGLLGYRIEEGVYVGGLTYEDVSETGAIWKKRHEKGVITDNEYDYVVEAFQMLYDKLGGD